jgi:hypothetical protein
MGTNFINPSDDIVDLFSSEALNEADQDFSELFLSMFYEARLIAVEECGEAVKFQIDRSAWQRGKWSILKRPKHNRGFWLTVCHYANQILPIGIGFALSDISTLHWLFALCLGIFAITFICEERLEDRR